MQHDTTHVKIQCLNFQPSKINYFLLDFGDIESVTGGKQVFACHNFLDYSGEARNSSISINIEETMAILTR